MTNEQIVRAKHPTAYLERQRTHGGKTYYIVRAGRANIGDGKTRSEAWKRAAARITPADDAKEDER